MKRAPAPPPRPAALEAAADPFAAAPGMTTQPLAQPLPPRAFAPSAPVYPQAAPPPAPYAGAAYNDEPIAGLGGNRPQWLIPVVVGLAALVVGGGIAIVLAR
jgi:hypothetical protein